MSSSPPFRRPALRVGTRGSPLALIQAERVVAGLRTSRPDLATEIVTIRTTGDAITDRPISEIGGKAVFVREMEEALRENVIDIAVHSIKDMETVLPPGLVLGPILAREAPEDALLCREMGKGSGKKPSGDAAKVRGIDALPCGAVIGTSSLRRRAQLLRRRGDLEIVPIRGNVGTRLDKLEAGATDAVVLAVAGLQRLGREIDPACILPISEMLPAPGQGAIGIELRDGDDAVREIVAPLDDPRAAMEIAVERAFLRGLGGSCRTPVGALARDDGGVGIGARVDAGPIRFQALLATPDGAYIWEAEAEMPRGEAEAMACEEGRQMRAGVDPGIVDKIFG